MASYQIMADCCGAEARDRQERRLLWVVLSLNAIMFVVEFTAGLLANSSALLADSLDMLADALVYSLSLYAVGKGALQKARSAFLNGGLQMILGIGVLIEVLRRAWLGVSPSAEVMGLIGFLALAVNLACLLLLLKFRSGDVNMRASWICSRNDVLANVGVLLAAGLVAWLGSAWPDLIIGALIAAVVIYSAGKILLEAKQSLADRAAKQ